MESLHELLATAPLPPGSTVTVVGGVYDFAYKEDLQSSSDGHKRVIAQLTSIVGSPVPGGTITIRAEPGKKVVFRVTYTKNDLDAAFGGFLPEPAIGFELNNGTRHVRIEGFELQHMQVGVAVGRNCQRVHLDNLHIHDIGTDDTYRIGPKGADIPDYHHGISTTPATLYCAITRCKIHDIGREVTSQDKAHCVSADKPVQFKNNLGAWNRRHGIYLQGFGHEVSGCAIWNVRMGAQIKLTGGPAAQNLPDDLMHEALACGLITEQQLAQGYQRPTATLTGNCFGASGNPARRINGGVLLASAPCEAKDGNGKWVKFPGNPPKNVMITGNLFLRGDTGKSSPASIVVAHGGRATTKEPPGALAPGLFIAHNQFATRLPLELLLPQDDRNEQLWFPTHPGKASRVDGNAVYFLDRWLATAQWHLPKATYLARPWLEKLLQGVGKATIDWFPWPDQYGLPMLRLNQRRLAAIQQALSEAESGLQPLQVTMFGNTLVRTTAASWPTSTSGACPVPPSKSIPAPDTSLPLPWQPIGSSCIDAVGG